MYAVTCVMLVHRNTNAMLFHNGAVGNLLNIVLCMSFGVNKHFRFLCLQLVNNLHVKML